MPKPYIPVFTPRTSAERARLKNWLSLVDGLFDENGQIQPTAFANLSVPSASLVDQGILTHSGSGTAKTLNAATTVVDGTYFTTGRPNKLRLVATDINATAVLYNDGSGNLNQNAATIGIKIAAAKTIVIGSNTLYDASGHLTLAAGSKITIGSQGIIDASGNFAIAAGKTITVGAQGIIDSSGNLALASGKTFKVSTTTIVNSSGQVPLAVVPEAMTWRTIYSSYIESDFACTVAAAEKSPWTRGGTWFTIVFLTFVRENATKDKYIRITFEQCMDVATVNTCDARIELDDENGHTITGTTVSQSGVTWTFKSQNTDISSLDTGRNITCQFRIQRSGGSDNALVRRIKIELGSNA